MGNRTPYEEFIYTLGMLARPSYETRQLPKIAKVIFNAPATIVFWGDKTKTVVKAQNDENYDPEKGLAMAISKKALGNRGNYCNEFHKWLKAQDVKPNA